ncbi:CsbD family protein [Streptomyces nanshensis]|uniref:CsbD family protein n=1 Tax=Streptomyces nanshensis TaxID=518642 RepID=UPI00085BFB30|nr:CsbD family protein [Streptomyces nanshensis]
MSAERKNQAKGEQLRGKVKERVGRALGNERMQTEGRSEQSKGDARHAAEKVKDIFRH